MEGDGSNVDVEDCTDDIYGDLESEIFSIPTKRPRHHEETIRTEEYQNLLKENQELKAKVQTLEKENMNYSRNISSLYLTAKTEIEKKNYTIKVLTERLKNLALFKSKMPKEDAEECIRKCQEAFAECQAQVTLDEIKKCLKNISPNSVGKRKHIKFGNMSLFFFREQIDFHREETVTFPDSKAEGQKTDNNSVAASSSSGNSPLPPEVQNYTDQIDKRKSLRDSQSGRRDSRDQDHSPNRNVLSNSQEGNCRRRSSFERDHGERDKGSESNSGERNSRRHSKDFTPPSNDRSSSRRGDEARDRDRNGHRKESDSGWKYDKGKGYYKSSDNFTRSGRRYSNLRTSSYGDSRHYDQRGNSGSR